MANNLFDQAPFALRGENDARIATLEARLLVAETELALIDSGAWPSYTPVLTASVTNPTSTIVSGKRTKKGRDVTGWAKMAFAGGMTAGSGVYFLSLPFTPADGDVVVGVAQLYDASVNTIYTAIAKTNVGNSGLQFRIQGSPYDVTATYPFTWATSDFLHVDFTYEAAS